MSEVFGRKNLRLSLVGSGISSRDMASGVKETTHARRAWRRWISGGLAAAGAAAAALLGARAGQAFHPSTCEMVLRQGPRLVVNRRPEPACVHLPAITAQEAPAAETIANS